MNMNKNPIEREFVIKAKGLAVATSSAEESIIERITYVVSTIISAWDQKLDTWYFDGAAEGEVGSLWRNYSEKEITPLIFIRSPRSSQTSVEMPIFDKMGEEWDLRNGFPSRWLFEDFESELINGKKRWETLEQEKQERVRNLSREKKALVDRAKKKLTKEELAALKGVL